MRRLTKIVCCHRQEAVMGPNKFVPHSSDGSCLQRTFVHQDVNLSHAEIEKEITDFLNEHHPVLIKMRDEVDTMILDEAIEAEGRVSETPPPPSSVTLGSEDTEPGDSSSNPLVIDSSQESDCPFEQFWEAGPDDN